MIVTNSGLPSTTEPLDRSVTIFYDIQKIKQLKQIQINTIEFALDALPEINWNSPKKVKEYFQNSFDITLKNVTIAHLEEMLDFTQTYSMIDIEEQLYGLLTYYKCKAIIKNYLDHILAHHGIVDAHMEDGQWIMHNKREISKAPEIIECELRRQTYDYQQR